MTTFFRKKWQFPPDPPTPWRIRLRVWWRGFKDRFYEMSEKAWEFVTQWTVYLVILGAVGGLIFLFVMYLTADRTPRRCWIEFQTNREPHSYVLIQELDWHPDNEAGRFISRSEAVELARLNGCPLAGDSDEK